MNSRSPETGGAAAGGFERSEMKVWVAPRGLTGNSALEEGCEEQSHEHPHDLSNN